MKEGGGEGRKEWVKEKEGEREGKKERRRKERSLKLAKRRVFTPLQSRALPVGSLLNIYCPPLESGVRSQEQGPADGF